MKTNNVGHTPTPWRAGNRHNIFTDDLRFMIAITDVTDKLSEVEQQANEEFIVRAVNSHEELLDLVKALNETIKEGAPLAYNSEYVGRIIAKAEGKI